MGEVDFVFDGVMGGILDKDTDNGYLLVKLVPGLDSFFIHESFKKEYKKNLKRFYSSLRF